MGIEDLQEIIESTKHRVAPRYVYIAVGFICVLLLILIFGLVAGIIYIDARNCDGEFGLTAAGLVSGPKGEVVCVTPDCLDVASWLAENMNTKVDPCKDFHAYACGGWEKSRVIPAEKGYISVVGEMNQAVERRIREILSSPVMKKGSAEHKMKDFFNMCIHDYGNMRDSGPALADIIRNKLKWWVLDPSQIQEDWPDMDQIIVDAHVEYFAAALFDYAAYPDMRDSNKNIITLLPAYSYLHFEIWEDEEMPVVEPALRDYIGKVGKLLIRDSNVTLEAEEEKKRLKTFVDDVMLVDRSLYEAEGDHDTFWDNWVITTVGEMERNFTNINWRDILRKLFKDTTITSYTEVQLIVPQYFKKLDIDLGSEFTSKSRMINNYIVWQVAESLNIWVNWEYRYQLLKFYETTLGYDEFGNTWDWCFYLVRSRLGLVLYSEYINLHIEENSVDVGKSMTDSIKKEVRETINSLEWMDDITKTKALSKLSSIESHIGLGGDGALFDSSRVEEFTQHLKVNKSESFLQNLIYMNEHKRYLLGKELSMSTGSNMVGYMMRRQLNVRPVYFFHYHLLEVPPGALQSPGFHPNVPAAVNYGTLGSAIAEELIDTFDQTGRWFFNGTYKQWWSKNTTSNYKERKDCLRTYYKGKEVGPYKVNGEDKTVKLDDNTWVTEILTRMLGLKTSYNAYSKWQQSANDPILPGLNLNSDQLYIVSSAQMTCIKRRDPYLYRGAKRGRIPHDMVLNSYSNFSSKFDEAFGCKKLKLDVTQCKPWL